MKVYSGVGATGSRLVTFGFRGRATTLHTTVETLKSHVGQNEGPELLQKSFEWHKEE